MLDQAPGHTTNELLRALPRGDYDLVRPALERVPLKASRVLHHPRTPLAHVYFVEQGLVSVLTDVGEGQLVEAWLVGREGLAGAPAVLGAAVSRHRRIVHLGGSALRMRREDLVDAMNESPTLRAHLLDYAHLVLLQASQVGACNARHHVTQRLARWLLMASDRCCENRLALTQDMLSRMLGVRRATVTQAVASLERRGLLRRARGAITIVDRGRLEGAACPCYQILKAQFSRIPDLRVARHGPATGAPARLRGLAGREGDGRLVS